MPISTLRPNEIKDKPEKPDEAVPVIVEEEKDNE